MAAPNFAPVQRSPTSVTVTAPLGTGMVNVGSGTGVTGSGGVISKLDPIGSGITSAFDPMGLYHTNTPNSYTLPVPAAPQFNVGSAPQQQFTNNNGGDFSTPSMADVMNAPHNAVSVAGLPPAAAPVAPPPVTPNFTGPSPQTAAGVSNIQQIINTVKQQLNGPFSPGAPKITNNASFNPEMSDAQIGAQAALTNPGGFLAHHPGFLDFSPTANNPRYGSSTPNTALSVSGISIPAATPPAPAATTSKATRMPLAGGAGGSLPGARLRFMRQ